jgi:hypothetical protein
MGIHVSGSPRAADTTHIHAEVPAVIRRLTCTENDEITPAINSDHRDSRDASHVPTRQNLFLTQLPVQPDDNQLRAN